MAVTTGQQVKMVLVSTQAKYNDLVGKDPATIYWVVETKKMYLDTVAYGFNSTDITPALINGLISAGTTGTVQIGAAVSGNKIVLSGSVKLLNDVNNLIQVATDELYVSKSGIETIIDNKITVVTNKIGAVNGLAGLDGTGKVPSSQLPSYVDDVVEYTNLAAFPATGEAGKIYIAKDTNITYRWPGSAPYVEISASLALGTTSSTAYRGDHGLTAYNHVTVTTNPHGVTKSQVGLGSVENYGIASQAQAEDGTSNVLYMTPRATKQAIAQLAPTMTWTVIS